MLVAAGRKEQVLRWPTLSDLIGERTGTAFRSTKEQGCGGGGGVDHVAGEAVEIIAGQEEKWGRLGARRRPRRLRTPSPLWIEFSCVACIGYVNKYFPIYVDLILGVFVRWASWMLNRRMI